MAIRALSHSHSMLALDFHLAHILKVAAAAAASQLSRESDNDTENDDAHDADACADYESTILRR